MYVMYWKPMDRYYTSYTANMNPIGMVSMRKSECLWIIPGTVDPRDD